MDNRSTRSVTKTKRGNEPGAARIAADTALTIAVGGTALALEKAGETVDHMVERAGDTVRSVRREVEDTAETTRHQIRDQIRKVRSEPDSRPYEERTRDELYALAAEREIRGRSTMRKAELIRALRAAQ